MPNNLVQFSPPNASENASAETERKRRLFAWADRVLVDLGLAERVRQASTIDELRRVTFDTNAADVILAIRDALHPPRGQRAAHFAGMNDRALKKILKLRCHDMKKDREAELRSGASGSRQSAARDWTDDLQLDDQGGVLPLLVNLILFMGHHPDWQGVLAFDEFTAQVVIRRIPPWGDEAPDTPWTDHAETQARVWFQRQHIKATLGDVGRAVQAAARLNPFHPVRDYFNALLWDGTPRLSTWLKTYFRVDDSAYVRAIGPRYLISVVARIYQPGCQVDHMLVLEGPQGRLKSAALRTLAVHDKWFTDRLSHIASKDAIQEIAGVLIVELAEMDALIKASPSAVKSFLTRRHDRFRPPYGKHPVTLRRQCVFAGSINPPVGGYLKDPTGARRFWPVTCRGMIDRDDLERDRDQLWAEAVHRYRAGEPWWLETAALESLAAAEQKARFKVDPWQPRVERWIGRRTRVRLSEVLSGALRIAVVDQTRSAEMRVASILTGLGFTKHRFRREGEREWCYEREPTQQEGQEGTDRTDRPRIRERR
jgi:putative DNA primase/helicase